MYNRLGETDIEMQGKESLKGAGIQLIEMRGIANSKDSELMQGLIHGRRSVRGHPKVIQFAEVKLGSGYLSTGQEDVEAGVTQEWVDEGELPRVRTKNWTWRKPYDVLAEATRMIRAAGELDCFNAHICLREPDKSEDKADTAYCLLRSLVEHSCINPKSPAFGYLDEKPIDTDLMKFLDLCPSALSWYLEFAFAVSTSSTPFTTNALPP
ncbi:hypothetical protein B296_00002652 [Ensete ventricosum]|uniref:Uncharacterized protein n=1 Tax=Ensete ventricosum TaxID=4639 RepID=A0A427AWA8_ENSVE|nr:hypothetical protein B296_00002652 [Ensete ventricosum]